MSVASPSLDLNPPVAGTWGRPVGMALVVHATLMVALAWGVGWKKDAMVVFEAEVWSALPQVAAPRAIEPEPPLQAPEPEAPPPPAPEPKPTPTPPPPPPQPAAKTPQVVTQKLTTKVEPQPEPRPPAKQGVAPDQSRQQQAQREAERIAREREAQQEAERKAQEQEAQRQAEARRQAQERERALQAQREADHQRNVERILGQANATGSTRATGQATASSGPSASYAGRLVAAIKPNIILTGVVAGNPRAEVELRVGPDGTILRSTLRQSSGSSAWDQAVLRAIERTGRLPLDENGRIPNTTVILGFRPDD